MEKPTKQTVTRMTLVASIANIQRKPLNREVAIDAALLLAIYELALIGFDAENATKAPAQSRALDAERTQLEVDDD